MNEILEIVLKSIYIFSLKVGIDLLSGSIKSDAFNKANKLYYSTINLVEGMYWILLYKTILSATNSSYIYIIVFGLGAVASGLINTFIKKKLDDKIIGQRKFFTRITVTDPEMVDSIIFDLNQNGFELAVTENQLYTNGETHTVIAGSLVDRKEMNKVKGILRHKKGFHVVFMRAEDIFIA